MKHKNNFTVEGRVWINSGTCSFAGKGKIELIEKIQELGSLRKAAADMKMSYRQAWYHLDKINKLSPKPLVILQRGGKHGGKAEVTDYAGKVINTYKQVQTEFDVFLKTISEKISI